MAERKEDMRKNLTSAFSENFFAPTGDLRKKPVNYVYMEDGEKRKVDYVTFNTKGHYGTQPMLLCENGDVLDCVTLPPRMYDQVVEIVENPDNWTDVCQNGYDMYVEAREYTHAKYGTCIAYDLYLDNE